MAGRERKTILIICMQKGIRVGFAILATAGRNNIEGLTAKFGSSFSPLDREKGGD